LSVIFPLPGAAATSLAVGRQNFRWRYLDPDIVSRVARPKGFMRRLFFDLF
jgi:hypothetical protein